MQLNLDYAGWMTAPNGAVGRIGSVRRALD
jgi:hypothetical protein